MRRGFVRCLWGVPSKAYRRNSKVINVDLEFIKYNVFDQPFTTYVFGESNLELLKRQGIENCKLISKDISLWDWKIIRGGEIDQYGHKLKTLEAASNDFDEFIFLDWDCMAVRPLPEDFWEDLSKKQMIQAHLRSYGMKQKYIQKKGSIWRDKDVNKRPCASFIYVRGKEMAEKIYNTWLEDKKRSDEKTLAIVTDEMMGGWDINKYWEMFEPNCFMLFRNENKGICFDKEFLKQKKLTFMHIHKQITIPCLNAIKDMTSMEDKKRYVTNKIGEIFSRFVLGTTGNVA